MPKPKSTSTPVRQSPRKRKLEPEAEEGEGVQPSPQNQNREVRQSKKTKTTIKKDDIVIDEPIRSKILKEVNGGSTKPATKNLSTRPDREESQELTEAAPSPLKKRKSKQSTSEDMPLADRAVNLTHYVGAHVSIAKGM